jgi:hypothetical protein
MATNTLFSERCELLHDFYMANLNNDEYSEFIQINDVGFPIAYLAVMGYADPTPVGVLAVNETWNSLCEMLEIDPLAEYAGIEEMMA